MADEQKTYCNGVSAKQITFQSSGKTILKLGVNAEKMISFLTQHQNAKGFVNLGISERREVGQYGDTHTVWLDTWQPESSRATDAPRTPAKPVSKPAPPTETDDVPF